MEIRFTGIYVQDLKVGGVEALEIDECHSRLKAYCKRNDYYITFGDEEPKPGDIVQVSAKATDSIGKIMVADLKTLFKIR